MVKPSPVGESVSSHQVNIVAQVCRFRVPWNYAEGHAYSQAVAGPWRAACAEGSRHGHFCSREAEQAEECAGISDPRELGAHLQRRGS